MYIYINATNYIIHMDIDGYSIYIYIHSIYIYTQYIYNYNIYIVYIIIYIYIVYVCVVIYYDYDHYDIFCEYCSERCLFDIEKVRSVYAESVG